MEMVKFLGMALVYCPGQLMYTFGTIALNFIFIIFSFTN